MLPSFLLYDACVVCFLTISFGLALLSVEEPSWMLWTCAYYFRFHRRVESVFLVAPQLTTLSTWSWLSRS